MSDHVLDTKTLRKLKFAQLALVDWLVEGGGRRVAMLHAGWPQNKRLELFERIADETWRRLNPDDHRRDPDRATNEEADIALADRLGGGYEIDCGPLLSARVLNSFSSLAAPKEGNKENNFWRFVAHHGIPAQREWARSVIFSNTRTLEWWNAQGKEAFSRMAERRNADRTAAERTILIGAECKVYPSYDESLLAQVPEGFKIPIDPMTVIRPTWTATVVKETGTRFYLKNVRRIRDVDRDGHERHTPVRGHAPNEHVDREHVIADPAPTALVEKLKEIDEDHAESFRRAASQELEKALPGLLGLHNRRLQANAMRDDLIREALAAHAPKPR